MAEVKPSTSRGEDPVEIVGEASCSGADASTYPESVPPSIAAESPSFFTWMWILILTACSGVWGARGTLGLACGAQRTHEDNESEVLSRIAASKSTWSEVPNRDIHHSVPVPCPSDLSVWEELKASAPDFFDDKIEERLEVGRMIAEGGQAQIFEAKWKGRMKWDCVLKVFKLDAQFSLADLKRHWPRSMRKDGEPGSNEQAWLSESVQEKSSRFVFANVMANIGGERCLIHGATLLKDGKFALVMIRYWGDLHTLIDQKVKRNTHRWRFDFISKNRRDIPPFSFRDSIDIMLQIARGMQGLHAEGVLHRDLKAANVLIEDPKDSDIYCYVADYECAMFVQGTRFWRAPEVLRELQKREEKDRNGDIWTKKVDVYSFGMTCYEILTGRIPFDGYSKNKVRFYDVIRGERPVLPSYVFPELQRLVKACWHAQPSRRPSFDELVDELHLLGRIYGVFK